jgi:hypothetical protein
MKFKNLYDTYIINGKVITRIMKMIPEMIPEVSFLNYENINVLSLI